MTVPYQPERYLRWLGSRGVDVFLVGGSVRDRLIGQDSHDLDVVVNGSAVRLGRTLANQFGGAFYVLDAERGAARALLPIGEGAELTVDLTRMAGDDIRADLSKRDFTINAMAMPLSDSGVGPLIDPYGGQSDLVQKRLRAVTSISLRDDPVRVLRAVRMAHKFELRIEPLTEAAVREVVPLLVQVSPERIRDELCRILSLDTVSVPVAFLDRLGALPFLFHMFGSDACGDAARSATQEAACSLRAVDVFNAWGHLLDRHTSSEPGEYASNLGILRKPVAYYREQLDDRLSSVVVSDRVQELLLKWVILLLYIGGEMCVEVMLTRLHFGKTEIRRGRTLVGALSRPGEWIETGRVTPGQLHRFYRETTGCGPESLLLYLADRLAASKCGEMVASPELTARLVQTAWRAYFEYYDTIVAPPQLVDGTILMSHFDLEPGPQIRELLECVQEAQAAGEIETKGDALRCIEARLSDDR